MSITPEEMAELLADYKAQLDAILATKPPYAHAMYKLGLQPFPAWLRENGYELPPPDLSDPYTARRVAEYEQWREGQLPKDPDARAKVEPHFLNFDDWLWGVETAEELFGPEGSQCFMSR